MKKKIGALLLAFVMVVGLLPLPAMADSAAPNGRGTPPTAVSLTAAGSEDETSPNRVPVLQEGVEKVTKAQVMTGHAFLLRDLQAGKIFEDPDGDKINYASGIYWERSADDGKSWSPKIPFANAIHGMTTIQVTEKEAGDYVYRFYVSDGKGISTEYWELHLHVVDKGMWNVNFYTGKDYNGNMPVIKVYPCLGVDEDGHDIPDYNNEVKMLYSNYDSTQPEGEEPYDPAMGHLVEQGYQAFHATLEGGKYSFRGFALNTDTGAYDIPLGGMCIDVPGDGNVDGGMGGGTDLFLQVSSYYVTNTKEDESYFTADDFSVRVDCPLMGCSTTMGQPYISNGYTYYPTMLYAAGNACLYNYYCYPNIPGYIFNQKINNTYGASTSVRKTSIRLSPAVELQMTVPEKADFGLYFQFNNFNTREVEPEGEAKAWAERAVVNGDGTKTYTYLVSEGNFNYTWRLSDPSGKYVTKSGWLNSFYEPTKMSFEFTSNDATNHLSHDFSKLGTSVISRDEADLMVNLDPSGFQEITEPTRVRAYRHWEIINGDASNIMVEPDFHWTVLEDGGAHFEPVNGGNATSNWIDVEPGASDTILAVSYDSISMQDNRTHGGVFPATNPERVGVIVVSGDGSGTADADVDFNMAKGAVTTRSMDWDYNYDTWFYNCEDNRPHLDFSVSATGDVTVETAFVTADESLTPSLSDFKAASAKEGVYRVDLRPLRQLGNGMGGTVIIRMTDETGTSYRLVRVAEMEVHAENASHPGENFMPGDDVNLTFDGLYRAVNKISGVFNPTIFNPRYSAGDKEFSGKTWQYQQMDSSSITVTIPEDLEIPEGRETVPYAFTNGYIYGSMYSAANPFAYLYNMSDTGAGTNFNAVTVNFYISHLADAVVQVHPKVYYNVRLTATDGSDPIKPIRAVLTDNDGNVVEPQRDGTYRIGYGDYAFSVMADGFSCTHGHFSLGSKSVDQVGEDGFINQTVVLEKVGENPWDGEKISEPNLVDGVYQISNAAELAGFAQLVNDSKADSSTKAVLTADIELAGFPWTPISNSSSNIFEGSFDGQGHTVHHLYIDELVSASGSRYVGLFGRVEGGKNHAVIRNLTVDGEVFFTSTNTNPYSSYVAGIVGRTVDCDLENLTNRVDVTVRCPDETLSYSGGVTSYLYSSNMTNCANEGNVNGLANAGGLTGYMHFSSLIDGCCNSGDIRGMKYVGGLAAQVTSSQENNKPMNTIQNSYNTGAVNGKTMTGGLVGSLESSPSDGSVLVNCFNVGAVRNGGSLVGEIGRDTAKLGDLYCLEGTSPFTRNVTDFTPKALSAEEMKSEDLVQELNKNAGSDLFGLGTDHPVFVRLGGILPDAPLTGDVNGDGRVDASDANLLYGYVNGLQSVIPQLSFGDVNGDGTITAQDANLIYGFVNGRLSVFPVNAK